MDSFVDFVTRLIYGTGAEAEITPNHSTWVDGIPNPTGAAWLDHHVDRMLPAFGAWLASHNLPPIVPWNGVRPEPWDATSDIPLGNDLDGSFTGISSLEDLGAALRDRFDLVGNTADELAGMEKAPFSYRYWGYVKWAQQMRRRYNGEIVVPVGTVYDYDGTSLSAIPFTNVFNELHWRWHLDSTAATGATPGLSTSAGQRAGLGGVGMTSGEEFIRFHRDHVELFTRWLARTGQPAVRGINMYNGNTGWPGSNAGSSPSTWVEGDEDPWINTEMGDADGHLRAQETDVDDLGSDMNFGIHGSGHLRNSDIAPISHNNYVPRFFAWHGWIDNQLWWRAPRFARWNAATGLRERVFTPVLSDGSDWPGVHALTILRDPAVATDALAPASGVAGLDFTTGAGTLRMKFHVQDSYGRPLTLRLKAEVFDDARNTTVPVETIPEATHTYTVGDTATGADFDLGTDFTVDFAFASAFQSDDPVRANPAVGFLNSRIHITGTLTVADAMDPDATSFVHTDSCDVLLVQEKQAPEVDLYFDLSSFGEDQVTSALSEQGGAEARFGGALIVVVQDRTSSPAEPDWPDAVADEVKGLITGPVPAAGLFADAAHAPAIEILDMATNTPIDGLTAELASGPELEDAARPDSLPQRFTYRYDVVFQASNDAFTGLAAGDQRFARVRVQTADRAGNAATEEGQIKLFNEANPYMRDGDPSWLSIDTRVFRLFEGEAKFGAPLMPGQPEAFIQQVIQHLNAGTAGGDTFDGLPENQPDSALEYSTAITNPSTGTSRNVHNFALAKVRLQGAAGAADVRAFFRLFRYTASNLIFDPATGYRTHDDGSGRKVPLLGFETAAGGDVMSIPFFAEARLPYAQPMTDQTDAPNVQSFPAGPTAERVLYFGAYLDINQDGARLPGARIAAHPDGGFGVAEVQPIRSLMTDAHQCMVVEIQYDGDPTATGDTPAASDNLAQRNLMILYTDNPGATLTHTVQHSFEVDTGRRLPKSVPVFRIDLASDDPAVRRQRRGGRGGDIGGVVDDVHVSSRDDAQGDAQSGDVVLAPAPRVPLQLISSERRQRLALRRAFDIAMMRARSMEEMMHPHRFMDEAVELVDQRFPFVFDAARWQATTRYFDELMFRWNDLPRDARVEVYLPRINCEDVINLRHLRHAPGDVRIVDQHTLELRPGGVTFLPLPPAPGDRIAGVITVTLPEGIVKGQAWKVDVVQLRGGERRTTGGFQLDIQVSTAPAIADAERRLLEVMHERLALTPVTHRWHPVLARRVETIRARAQALAESAGIEWVDPTVWVDPDDPAHPHPLEGQKIRVVLEKVQILEDRDPWIKGKGEVRFNARVRTEANGGIEQRVRLPARGVFKISDKPGHNVVELNETLFTGYAADDLRVQIVATELDTFDPDDTIGKYTRIFSGAPTSWLGRYAPGDEAIDPEDAGAWRVWYRIERA